MLFYKNHIALFLCLFWITPVLGQQNILNRRVTIRFEDHSVEDALEKLMKETKCTINYRPSELPANFRITKFFKQASIRTIIREVWNSNRLIFQVEGNDITVQVTPKDVKNQKGHLKGRLTDIKGNSIPGATIRIKGTTIGNITDLDGWYTLPDLKAGSYTLFISSLGFQRTEQSIEIIGGSTVDLQTTLKDEVGKLDEVVVLGKSQEQLKMEEPIKVEVINTQKLQTKSISLPQIINQTTGIKVRQTGGIGSPTLVNINGLQGNAIRYFKDEIPMDYLGRAFDLTLLPVDQIDNVEIYKGVLPAELGADALGGALNFSSRKNFNNNLDLAYTIGSFNTHQVNLNGYYQIPNTKLFTSLASYYVYSDNNYKVSVPLPDPVTANLVDTEVERFHDAVESYFIDGKVGIKDFKFGDLLVFGYARFDYEKERQNGVGLDPNSALGEVMDLESSDIFSTQYKLTKGKLSVNVFGSYSDRNTLFIDNPEFRYNWLGEQLPLINQGGETNFSSRYYRQLNFKTWTGRVNAKYKLTDKHELTFNHNIISENRIGSDTLEIIFGTDIDPNSLPSDYTRNVSGLGLSSVILNDKIKNVVTAKRFSVSTASTSRLQGGFFIDGTLVEVEKASYGIGNSTKVKIGSNRFIRVSYEYATRIPENIEFLGDGLFVLGNPGLKPETSHNVNTGFFSNLGKQKKHWIDVNLFYRFIMDNIFLEQAGFSEAVFRNQDDARVYGAELSIRGEIIRSLRYNFSTTYQDIRRANSRELNLESAREPNIPYFFSNLGLRYNHSRELLRGNWDAYLNYGFIEKYLLTTLPKELEPALFGPVDKVRSTTIIDTQHTLDLGVTYSYTKMPLWVSFEVNNVLDIPVFDGFRVQLPGRNFRLKLKCRINGK